jgi:peptidoglycan-associated lipoprotein
MKRAGLVISVLVAGLLLSGCEKKSEVLEAPQEQASAQQTEESVPEQTTIEEEMVVQMSQEQLQALAREIASQAKKIYFDFDRYDIRPDQEPNVDYDARLFEQEDAKRFTIQVEGNCDEWGTDEYNYALGLKRAKSVRDALAQRGVDPARMTIKSYGESNPVCMEHTPECWAKNRRVEFTLFP